MELKSEREIGVKILKEKSWKLDTQTEKTKELGVSCHKCDR